MKGFVIVENLLIIAPAGTLSVSFQRLRSSRILMDVSNMLMRRQSVSLQKTTRLCLGIMHKTKYSAAKTQKVTFI